MKKSDELIKGLFQNGAGPRNASSRSRQLEANLFQEYQSNNVDDLAREYNAYLEAYNKRREEEKNGAFVENSVERYQNVLGQSAKLKKKANDIQYALSINPQNYDSNYAANASALAKAVKEGTDAVNADEGEIADYYSSYSSKLQYDRERKYDAMSYDELVKERDALDSQKTAPAWLSKALSALTPSQQRSEKFKADAEAAYDKQYALEQINSRIADVGYRDKVEKLDDETKQLLADFDAARINYRGAAQSNAFNAENGSIFANPYDTAEIEATNALNDTKRALLGTINPNTNKRFTEEEIADYADYLAINKGKQEAVESAEKNAELATEHTPLAFGKRTVDTLAGGISSTLDTLGQVAELASGNRRNIDVYNPAFQYNRNAQTIDQTIMDNNDFMVGDVDLLDFGYKVATSVADNALRTVAGGGNPTVAAIYMATQGFGQTVQDSVEKGYSPTKAIANGVINAGIEAITEKYSLEKILDQKAAKSILVALGKSFLAEGSEEVAGDALSAVADAIMNGNYSELATQYNELVANGVAPKQALAEVAKNQFGDLVESFLVGGFSGGIMGGGAYASQFAENAKNKVSNAIGGKVSDIRNTNALMAGNADVQAAADLNVDAETNDRYKKALEAYKAVNENATKKETKSAQKELKSAARKVASQLRLSTNEKVTSALKTSLNEELSSANATEEQIKSIEKLVDRKVLTEADNKNIDDLRDSVGADKLQSIFQTANNAARSESAKIQVDAALKAGAKTLPNTDDYNKTQNGDTVIHNDNTVEVIGIDAKSGNITLSDKSVVKPGEIEMSEDMADVIEGVKNIGRRFSIESGDLNTIFAYAKSAISNNTNSVALGLALDDAMMFGYIGQKDLNRSSYIASFGNNPVAMRAINEAYKMAAESSRLAKNIESVKVSKSKKKGTVRYDNVNISEYSEDKQTEAKAVESISSLSPIETVIYDSSKRTDDLGTKNGAFYKDGRLWVDINAEQGVLGAFAHELTHFMREYNEGSFNKIARILISEYGSGKYSAMDAADIARNYANSLKMTVDDAFEEYVADCMTRMLTDSNAAETIAKLRAEDAKLADKIASFIRDAVAKIKAALSGTKAKGYSEITKSLDRWQELADLFAEGVAGAMSAYENGVKAASSTESEKVNNKFSVKDSEGKTLTEQQSEYFKNSKVRDADGNLLVVYHGTDAEFNVFDILKAGKNGRAEGFGFYFTDDTEISAKYGNNQKKVYLNITKPLYGDRVTLKKSELEKLAAAVIDYENKRDDTDWRDSFISNYIYTYGGGSKATYIREFVDSVWENAESDQDLIYEIANGAGMNYDAESAKEFYDVLYNSIGVDGNIAVWEHADGESAVYVAFRPEQIKLTSNEKPTSDVDIRYSEKNSEYLELAKDPVKNEAKLNEMVKQAAENAGYNKEVYHGTTYYGDITKFKKGRAGYLGAGIYLAKNRSLANRYANAMGEGNGKIYDLYVKANNPLTVTTEHPAKEILNTIYGSDRIYNNRISKQSFENFIITSKDIQKLKDLGYDAVIWDYSTEPEMVVFNSSQIKSADLVTYDDSGNIIPLSERFNTENEDIRYSRKGSPIDITAETEYSEILKKLKDTQLVTGKSFKEYAKAKEKSLRHAEYARDKLVKENEQLAEMVRLQRKQTNGKVITPSSINTVAKRIYKEAGAKGNVDEFAKLLGNLYNGVINGEEITLDMNNSVVDWLVEHHKAADKNADYQAVRKFLRGSKVYLSSSLRTEIEALYGSVAEYSKLINNAIKFTNDETDARFDDVWADLTNEFSEFFDGDATEINQPAVLADVLDALESSTTELQEYQDSLEDVKMWYLELIYEGYTDVSTLYTVADQYGDKILKLKLAQKKKIAELKKESAERLAEVEKAYKEEKREFSKARTAEREALRKELVAKYTEMRKRNVEGRSKTVEKNKILRAVKELDTLLNKGNKKRNVKIGMEDFAEKALYMTDVLFNDVKPNHILRGIISGKIQAKLTKKERMLLDEYELIDGTPAPRDDAKAREEKKNKLLAIEAQLGNLIERETEGIKKRGVFDAINGLKDAYNELKNSEQSYISDVYNEAVAKRIDNFAKEIQDKHIEDLTAAQMHQFYEVIRMVSTTISNANKEFVMGQARDITELGQSVGDELAGGKDTRYKIFDPFKRFFYADMKPVFYFDHIGSKTLKTLFDNVREGEKVFARDVEEARKFILDTKAKYGFDEWDLDKVKTFKLTSGQDFKINLNQMMSIYAYSRREQALEHMAFGGFRFADKAMKDTDRKFKPKIRNTSSRAFRVNSVDFRKIADSLTEEQKKYVVEMQNYLTAMGAKGNEVSRRLYGIDIFKERVYFPLRTAKEFMKSADTIAANKQLENSGFTKETVPNADNPIILDNFTDVWGEHINKMSLYHSMTLPIRALRRTFEYTGIYSTGKSESVRTIMTKRFDEFATNYLDKFIQDLNGGITTEESSFLSSLFTKMKKSAVAASTSVVIQQPTAIARAMALINPKYFVAPKAATVDVKKNWEEAKRYAPVVIIKEIGGFDTGAGKGVSDWLNSAEYSGFKNKLKGFAKDSQYRDDVLSAGAEIADEVGWSIIWEAVKKETADKTNLSGEELLKAAGKRFDEVITYTQVYDSVTSRSSFMRSDNEVTKMATAFMGEPTTSINLLSYAIIESKRGKITKAHAGRIVSATLSSIVFAAMAKCLPYALRDDDDDKTFAEKYIEKLSDALFGLGSDIAPWNMVPYLKDLISIWQGYDVDRADITIVSDLVKAIKGLDSTKKSGWVKMENLLGSIGALFGVPIKNLMRTMREIYNLFLAFVRG